jgi:hypothetical protein
MVGSADKTPWQWHQTSHCDGGQPMFRLLRYFSLTSLISIVSH